MEFLRTKITLPLVLGFALGLLPLVAVADSSWRIGEPIVPCGGERQPECDFNQGVHLVGHIISFLLYCAVLIAAIAFTVAGFKYVTAAGNESQVKEAHNIFKNVAVGLIIALSAWLIVDTILKALANQGYSLLGR